MAIFNFDPLKKESAKDLNKVFSHLYQLNDYLAYMFSNLNPDDNYSDKALVKYVEDGKRISEIEISVDGIKLTMVTKSNIVQTINLSDEGIQIKGNKISLEGTITANGRFKINMDGSMETNNGRFSGWINAADIRGSHIEGNTITGSNVTGNTIQGNNITGNTINGGSIIGNTITGGTIRGATIEGNTITGGTVTGSTVSGGTISGAVINGGQINGGQINGGRIFGELEIACGERFWVRDLGSTVDYSICFGAFEARHDSDTGHVFASHDSKIRMRHSDGAIECEEIYIDDPWMKGWGLVRTLRWLYDLINTSDEG